MEGKHSLLRLAFLVASAWLKGSPGRTQPPVDLFSENLISEIPSAVSISRFSIDVERFDRVLRKKDLFVDTTEAQSRTVKPALQFSTAIFPPALIVLASHVIAHRIFVKNVLSL
jgi:hypothetical protein